MTSENGAAADRELTDADEQDLVEVESDADLDVAEDTEVEQVESEDGDDENVDDAAEAGDELAAEAVDENLDPAEEMRAALRHAPGDWYVVHSYAGYENKVKTNLETRIQTLDMEDYIFQVEVPTEEVTEIKNGQRKQVQRKVLPGYILVRMELNDNSWSAVRNTPGVTGFVGATSKPSPLSLDDVLKFLLPQVEQDVAIRRGRDGREELAVVEVAGNGPQVIHARFERERQAQCARVPRDLLGRDRHRVQRLRRRQQEPGPRLARRRSDAVEAQVLAEPRRPQ